MEHWKDFLSGAQEVWELTSGSLPVVQGPEDTQVLWCQGLPEPFLMVLQDHQDQISNSVWEIVWSQESNPSQVHLSKGYQCTISRLNCIYFFWKPIHMVGFQQ